MTPRKLLLRTGLPPGDMVMLTAAVRDIHRCHPGRFLTDVRTACPAIWEHNPWLTPLSSRARDVEVIDCHYPLVDRSNQAPLHCLNGYAQFLSERLAVPIDVTEFKGDVHISSEEQDWFSQVHEITGEDTPFWIVAAGGKRDYTIKWWETARYQEVVDYFRGRILFVQVGQAADHHPPLRGVLDLRGRTDLRQLIRLVYHAQGVLCPVTSLMHLAAAIEVRPGRAPLRPCVVVAGAREPSHWEAYPGHQFIHTVGLLPCCATGGCWRARTLPLGDGDKKDKLEELCEDVINGLPHCMHLIEPAEVIRRIELYFTCDQTRYLDDGQWRAAEPASGGLRRAMARNGQASLQSGHSKSAPASPPSVTICVLTSGDHHERIRRCLDGVRRSGNRARYRLVVGGNAVSNRVRRYLLRLQQTGFIDRLHLSPSDIGTTAMMRRMFGLVDTELVWWFDDDCYVRRRGTLERWLEVVGIASNETSAWGHGFPFSAAGPRGREAVVSRRARPTEGQRGRAVESWSGSGKQRGGDSNATTDDRRRAFLAGGCWMIRTSALRDFDWPEAESAFPGDEALIAAAKPRPEWKTLDVGPLGVARLVRSQHDKDAGVIRRKPRDR